MIKQIFAVAIAAAMVTSCASKAKDIKASYVSSTLYESLSCAQLREEAMNVSNRAIVASGEQDKQAGNDAAAVTVGMVIFWPAIFFAKGDGASAAEVSRLKGEMQAIEKASLKNNCGIKFDAPTPQKTAAKKTP
jgi:hypothetical protein